MTMTTDETLASADAPADANAAAEIPAPADVVAIAAAVAIAAVQEPALTPAGRVRRIIEQAAARTFPSDQRRAEAVVAIQEFGTIACGLVRNCDYAQLSAEIAKFGDRTRRLSLPLPPVLEMDRVSPFLRALGWAGMEIDILRQLLRPGEKIVAWDIGEVRLEMRTLTRRAIRDAGRPAWWKTAPGWNQLAWESQFRGCAPIPGERAS